MGYYFTIVCVPFGGSKKNQVWDDMIWIIKHSQTQQDQFSNNKKAKIASTIKHVIELTVL